MERRPIRPGRLRRRLTIAFALVAALSAAALAAGSYLVVRESRLDDSVTRGVEQSRFNLELADDVLRAADDPAESVEELLPASRASRRLRDCRPRPRCPAVLD